MKELGKKVFHILGAAAIMATSIFTASWHDSYARTQKFQAAEQMREFSGEEVVLAGRLVEIVGSRAFLIELPQLSPGYIMIVSSEPLYQTDLIASIASSKQAEFVLIHGIVHEFDLGQFEQVLATSLADEGLDSWQGHPVVLSVGVMSMPNSALGPI